MRLRYLPLASQIILVISVFLFCVFLALTWGVLRQTEKSLIDETSRTLEQEAKVMAGTLDTFYGNVEERAERQLRLFTQWVGGAITPGGETVRTGEIDLPAIRIGGELINGRDSKLAAFREMTGDEAAFLAIKDGKLYRAATLLKRDGKPMDGTARTTFSSFSSRSKWIGSGRTGCCGPKETVVSSAIAILLLHDRCIDAQTTSKVHLHSLLCVDGIRQIMPRRLLREVQRLQPVARKDHAIVVAQNVRQQGNVLGRIIDDENRLVLQSVHGSLLRLPKTHGHTFQNLNRLLEVEPRDRVGKRRDRPGRHPGGTQHFDHIRQPSCGDGVIADQ